MRYFPLVRPFRPALLGLVLATLLALVPRTRAAGDDHDLWYVLEISGKRAGWMHSEQKTQGDRITCLTEMRMAIGRGDSAVRIMMRGESIETTDGKPISMKKTEQMGKLPVTSEFTFEPAKIRVVTEQDGKKTESEVPLPEGTWLTPAQAGEFVRKRLEAGAKEIVVRSMEALDAPRVSVSTHKVLGKEDVQALGKTISAVKWTSTIDSQPGIELTEYVDERGIPVRTETNLGIAKMVVLLADKELATSRLDPPELLASTLIHPNRPIAGARRLPGATYLLSIPAGGQKLADVPSTSAQRAERVDDHKVRVRIDVLEPTPASESEAGDAAYTRSSAMINAVDPRIKELVAQATRDAGPGKRERAEAMRRFVNTFISKKDLDVGFATASEVAQTKRGDCSEHGVLLCAMLRADGIPARVASGLIYADRFAGQRDIFGYHMWAEGLFDVEGKKVWIDLDGTLEDKAFDATHIVLATSPLGDGEAQNSLVALAPSLGKLKIEVEETK